MLISQALILSTCSLSPDADLVPAADNGQKSITSSPVTSVSNIDILPQKDKMSDDKIEQDTFPLLLSFA